MGRDSAIDTSGENRHLDAGIDRGVDHRHAQFAVAKEQRREAVLGIVPQHPRIERGGEGGSLGFPKLRAAGAHARSPMRST
jgi:hypothetical protein